MLGTIKVDKPLGDPTKVTRLVMEVTGEGRDASRGEEIATRRRVHQTS